MTGPFRSGFVALVGRPNVGKSTLLNRLIGERISITSQRPQTTRHRLLGIKTLADAQIVYVDTPGLHLAGKRAINRYMNRVATASLEGVDAVVLVAAVDAWNKEDDYVLGVIGRQSAPVILAINKIDTLKDRKALLPLIDALSKKLAFREIVPISATEGENVPPLEQAILKLLPERPPLFPEDQITDRSERFLAGEFVREQIFRVLRQELPYAVTVQVEKFAREDKLLRIDAVIWVERPGQKAILIGKQGAQLKQIGSRARQSMERLFGTKVYLQLWVKVREGWSDDERALRAFGYHEEG